MSEKASADMFLLETSLQALLLAEPWDATAVERARAQLAVARESELFALQKAHWVSQRTRDAELHEINKATLQRTTSRYASCLY